MCKQLAPPCNMYKQIILNMIPEILLLIMLCIILLLDAFSKQKCIRVNYIITILGMLTAGCCAGIFYQDNNFAEFGFIFNETTMALKVILCIIAGVVLFYAKEYLRIRKLIKGDYFSLYILAVIGMLLLVSSNNFLTMYLSIELFSLPIYALIALNHHSDLSLEAAVKYFVLGALASCILLYGISLLYGASGDIAFVTIPISAERITVFKFSMIFILVGMFFKLGLTPFHMWLPDVYEGAPTAITALLATAPKIAVAVVVGRFLFGTYAVLINDWQNIILLLAITSIGFGNLMAIVQNNIKRMLAYSAIANIGFAILGFIANERLGFAAVIFYVITYAIIYLGIFGALLLLREDTAACIKIEDFNGLWIHYPWLAIMFLLFLFALVGVPPFAGFYAKFLILKTLIEQGLVSVSIFAIVFSAIGICYCLKLVKAMFFLSPALCTSKCSDFILINGKFGINIFSYTFISRLILVLNCLVVVCMGICMI